MTPNLYHLAKRTYSVSDLAQVKKKMLNWLRQFNIFCFLDNQHYNVQPHRYECIIGAGVEQSIDDISKISLKDKSWYFGHLSYEFKKQTHHTAVHKKDQIGFQDAFFFKPQYVLLIQDDQLVIHAHDPDAVYIAILESYTEYEDPFTAIQIQQRLSVEAYIEKIKQLQQHILLGNCYEINFCQEFFAEQVTIDPFSVFQKLMGVSPNPFAALYRCNDSYLICASPERYLLKSGNTLISQPIKGTIKRDVLHNANDEALILQLKNSKKDQSENVMIVDLVRNDLSRICREASVKVDELFGIYTYPQVHQMISTISGQLNDDVSFNDIISATFPMGSMTGAPKHKVMQLIDAYEPTGRGIFSGSVGYIDPDGDFDLNVVIRSIMYNTATAYLSYQVGSGITFYSDPVKEWEECLLKGEAIKKVLAGGPAL